MRHRIVLAGLLLCLLAPRDGAAETIGVGAGPSPAEVEKDVTVRIVVADPPRDERVNGFRFIVGPEGAAPFFETQFGNANTMTFKPNRSGTWTLIGVVQFVHNQTGAFRTNSGSMRLTVRSGLARNPFTITVDPPTGLTTQDVILRAKLKPGIAASAIPPGGKCTFRILRIPDNRVMKDTTNDCGDVRTQLDQGSYLLRLSYVYVNSPAEAPSASQIQYSVRPPYAGISTAPLSCPAGCSMSGAMCIAPAGAGPCGSGGSCPRGYACTSGFCTQTPATSGLTLACASNRNCPFGLVCTSNQCRMPLLAFACGTDADCDPANRCINGECRVLCKP